MPLAARSLALAFGFCVFAAACAGDNVLRPVTREEAISACVAYGSCIPSEGVHQCFARDLLRFQPDEIRCLAAAGADCSKVSRCIGKDARNAGASCAPACEGGRLVSCHDVIAVRTDCGRWAASDATCMSSPVGALSPSAACAIASCGTRADHCDGTRRVTCDAALGLLVVEDCRERGDLTCVLEGGASKCVGTGVSCAAEGSARCDGDVLVRCTGGREERHDCRIGFEGGGCRATTGADGAFAFCGFDSECRPKPGEEACSGDGLKLTFCAAGQKRTLDCVQAGHRGCAGRACAPNLP